MQFFSCERLRSRSAMFPNRFLVLLFLAAVVSIRPCSAQLTRDTFSHGVSLAGAEFGADSVSFSNLRTGDLGVNYVFPKEDTIRYFSKLGVRRLRLPFRWERVQPALGRDLHAAHVAQLRKVCRSARQYGCSVLLDVHNYARYRIDLRGIPRTCVIDEHVDGEVVVSRDDFADLWRRLALEFRGERGVAGYALMNEPHDMGRSDWKQISQHAVDAIRVVDQTTPIVVSGDCWASAENFETANGTEAWIRDPSKKTIYEAHCYFDHDSSGKYMLSFRKELENDSRLLHRGRQRVKPFLAWCKRNGVRGLIGEYGTPADTEWRDVTVGFLNACTESQVPVFYWAAGEWWGNYPLSVQPEAGSAGCRPQLNWLLTASQPNETHP